MSKGIITAQVPKLNISKQGRKDKPKNNTSLLAVFIQQDIFCVTPDYAILSISDRSEDVSNCALSFLLCYKIISLNF